MKRGDFPYPKEPEKPAQGGSGSSGSGGNGGSSGNGGSGGSSGGSNTSGGGNSSGGGSSAGSSTPGTGNGAGSGSSTGSTGSQTGNSSKDSEKKKESNKKDDKVTTDKKKELEEDEESDEEKTDRKVVIIPGFRTFPLNNGANNAPLAGETEEEVTDIETVDIGETKEDGLIETLRTLFSENSTDIMVGTVLFMAAAVFGILIWSHSVEVYCYDGGDSYKKLGVAFVKKSGGNYEMSLPENMTDSKNIPRYRLILKKNFAKRCKGMSLTILTGDRKLQQSMEECMDFAL